MAQVLTLSRLSYLNLRRKPCRTYALIIVVAILSFILFGGTVLSLSMKNGIRSVEARFGADLIVVPLGYESKQKAILLTGEPSYFYLDREIVKQLERVEGISKLSTQYYLTSLNSSCCSIPVQIIGFEPVTDFTISPWIRESIGGNIEKGALIVGSDIELKNSNQLTLFNKEYPVASRLEKTGTGLDQSVFASIETIQDLLGQAKDMGLNFLEGTEPTKYISSVLIKVKEGFSIDQVASSIRKASSGIQIVRTQGMIAGISKSIGNFISFYQVLAITLFIITLLILSVVFTATANERKKELATLRILGATRKKLTCVLLWEAIYISAIGGITGIALAVVFVFPFNAYIANNIDLPYLMPSIYTILLILAATLFLTVATGPIASACLAVKISRSQTYLTLREGE